MKKFRYTLVATNILLLLTNSGCEVTFSDNKSKSCDVDDPLYDLEWLSDIRFTLEARMTPYGGEVIQYTYDGATVFWVDMCYGCADNMIQIYNCEGEVICEFGGIAGVNTCPDFETNATDSLMLISTVQR